MWTVARRPRWIGALVLALSIAVAFVLLSQWQIERGIEQATVIERDTETTVPLESVAEPQSIVTSASVGQRVTVSGEWVDDDFAVLSGRLHEGGEGYWAIGHLVTDDGVSLAVALGWSASEQQAREARPDGDDLVGRYISSEAAQDDDYQNGVRKAMAVPALINDWSVAPVTVYGGFLALGEAPGDLTTIVATQPAGEIELNWLNIFYAIEWVVFAGFAVYFWFRLVRDAWEREQDEAAEAAQLESNHGAA